MALYRACVSSCVLRGAALVSCEVGVLNWHVSQSCLQPTMRCIKTTMEKTALCTKTCPLSTKIIPNLRLIVPLPRQSSERNRQLLEAEGNLLCVEESHIKRWYLHPWWTVAHGQLVLEQFVCLFSKPAINNGRFGFVCNKLIQSKFSGSRLFCPQQIPKPIKGASYSLEVSTWWLWLQNHKQYPFLGILYLCASHPFHFQL